MLAAVFARRNLQTQPLKFRSRARLIAAVVAVQALVIGLGWIATLHMAEAGLDGRVRRTVAGKNERLAETFAVLLAKDVSQPITEQGEAWETAQKLIEGFRLPAGTTLFLLDESGRVVCHPAARRASNIREIDYADQVVRTSEGHPATLGSLNPLQTVSGETELLSGPASISVLFSRETRTKIVVQTLLQGATAETEQLSEGMFIWGGIAGAATLLVTVVCTAVLVRRYDSMLMRVNKQLEEELQRRIRRAMSIRNGLIFGLAKLADYRDTDTGKHLERICRYSELLAVELMQRFPEIDRPWIERLKLAASLHDIGKVGIPDTILLKPSGLTIEERKQMQQHVVLGADTLIAVRRHVGDDDLINMAIQVTLSHHERWDGKGYPYGISGPQIPFAGRIVALADVYDALTSHRVYKPAMTHDEARKIIKESRGTHLDPEVVDAFERIQLEFDAVREKLQSGEVERPPLMAAVEQLERARASERVRDAA